jgi:small subunit ribosomal protein S4
MSKLGAAKCKLCRRAKGKLFLKGERCYSAKCAITRRPYVPGQHGPTQRGRLSDYGVRLREKQKARQTYGLTERQFENYFEKAVELKGVAGTNLLILLERRLDNVAYRLGLSVSRIGARQLVRHGHVRVNGRKVDIPSFQVRVGDVIVPSEKAKPKLTKQLETAAERKHPNWVSFDEAKLEGKILRLPERGEIDTLLEEQKVIEYYSR